MYKFNWSISSLGGRGAIKLFYYHKQLAYVIATIFVAVWLKKVAIVLMNIVYVCTESLTEQQCCGNYRSEVITITSI